VDDINAARRDKKTALSVPYDCVISPAAQDMAVDSGIAISRQPCTKQTFKKQSGASDLPRVGVDHKSTVAQDKLLAEIKAKVLDKLPTELHNSEVVEQLIRKHLEMSGCACEICRPVARGRPAVGAETTAPLIGWKNAASGALQINSAKLPWKDFSGGGPAGAVHILDAVTAADGAPFSVGYMEWKDVSFPWKLDYHEVCIVLQGKLCIGIGGQRLEGEPGDALYLPKGAEVEFAASGYVKFVYVIWPADWAR
jgi:ethanolamine utilization protein EutQ